MSTPFVEIEHSGDIGIEASGRNMSELLENATRGLLGLFCRGKVEAATTRVLNVESSSKEDLLVDWLAEVIATIGTHGELYGVVEVTEVGEYFAKGVLRGEKVDPARHDLRFDVKAVTYHDLSIEEAAGVLRGRVIFDL